MGADKVVDYETEDFTKDDERYDFVFDAVDKTSFAACKPLMQRQSEPDRELIEKGRRKPIVDRKYPLEKIADALLTSEPVRRSVMSS